MNEAALYTLKGVIMISTIGFLVSHSFYRKN